ncbi:hypothetical protein [Bacillus solitudinis]|uniref:hypothetical protein n=1 Tax=Bacillus solitudinis TaxID=2014074 RepID=UPI000C23ADF2|nr:hypothetical protein [Bacillus solitudinis]
MKNVKIFMYFFLFSGLFGLSSIYLRENFGKPLNSLEIIDMFRMVMAGLVQIASMFLVYDTFLRFKEISKGKKRFLLVVAIPCSIVYFLFLIGVYLE